MMIAKPQIFLDHIPGGVYHLSGDCLVGSFDRALAVGSQVCVDIVFRRKKLKLQGSVDSLRRHHQKYIGTIVWQDRLQQEALNHVLHGHPYQAHNYNPAQDNPVNHAGNRENPSPSPAETLSDAFLKRKRRGYALLACVGAFLVFGMVVGLWQTFFRIYADAPFAAVTVPLRAVTASESGQLTWTASVGASDRIKKGQVLGRIVSPKIQEDADRLQSDLSFLQTQIDLLREKKRDATLISSYRQQSAQDFIRQKEERLRGSKADYDQALSHKKRMEPLYHKGYISRVKWDVITAAVSKAKALVDEDEAVLSQAKTEGQMTQQFSVSSGNSLQGTPQDLDREISEKLAQYENLMRERRFLDGRAQSLTLISPCDCRVISAQNNKTWVNQGSTVMRLQESDRDTIVVEARLPAYVADRVQVGDVARVSMGDQGRYLSAHVVDVRPVVAGDRYGLSPQVMQDPALTSVYLKPLHQGFSGQEAGMHADVSIHTYKRSGLYRLLPPWPWGGSAQASSDFHPH
jgi:multidrug resistance efflux pump